MITSEHVKINIGDMGRILAETVTFSGEILNYHPGYGGVVLVELWRDECCDAPGPIPKGFRGYQPPENRFIDRKQRVKR